MHANGYIVSPNGSGRIELLVCLNENWYLKMGDTPNRVFKE